MMSAVASACLIDNSLVFVVHSCIIHISSRANCPLKVIGFMAISIPLHARLELEWSGINIPYRIGLPHACLMRSNGDIGYFALMDTDILAPCWVFAGSFFLPEIVYVISSRSHVLSLLKTTMKMVYNVKQPLLPNQ